VAGPAPGALVRSVAFYGRGTAGPPLTCAFGELHAPLRSVNPLRATVFPITINVAITRSWTS
jgi:hypothetical protein